jgi:hypothetical protein
MPGRVRQAEFDVLIEGSLTPVRVRLHVIDMGRSCFFWVGAGAAASERVPDLGAMAMGAPPGAPRKSLSVGSATIILDGSGDADVAADFARALAGRLDKMVLGSWCVDAGVLDAPACAEVQRRALCFLLGASGSG